MSPNSVTLQDLENLLEGVREAKPDPTKLDGFSDLHSDDLSDECSEQEEVVFSNDSLTFSSDAQAAGSVQAATDGDSWEVYEEWSDSWSDASFSTE